MSLLLAATALAGAVGVFAAGSAQESPIFCNLKALTPAERDAHSASTKRLDAAVTSVEDVEGGYRIHLSADVPAGELLQWVEAERKCCPFIDFEVRLARENGARSLQMTGRDGVKAFLASEFKLDSRR